jgi:hypothetical protein
MEKICKNCKYAKEIYNTPTMDGKAPVYISCIFLVNGIKIRGSEDENYICDDFEEIKMKI